MLARATALTVCCVFVVSTTLTAQQYERFFGAQTMRIDYFHLGTKGDETFSIDRVYEEGPWPGSSTALIDTMNLGEYMTRVYDVASGMLVFSRGYSTMFNEWQTTEEAAAGVRKTFHETIRLPFPKGKIQVTIARRDRQMIFRELFSTTIDPGNPTNVVREFPRKQVRVTDIRVNGEPAKKVDLLILGDGYAQNEMEKLRKDARHFADVLFDTSPFKERAKDFNVRLAETASDQSGIDKPDANVWKRTELGTSYNTFGSARYILTEYNKDLRDLAAAAPYDFLAILCNDNRYGGGGIYNLYTTCYTMVDKPGMEWQMEYVFVHELGHSFGGLGDEYYTSDVAYSEFYPKGVEPWEPNVTALLDPRTVKWQHLVKPRTPLPTPWQKAKYDSLERERAKLDRLAPDYYQKREPLYQAGQQLLRQEDLKGVVGAFQGAGYASEGFYRPSLDCRMFSLSLVAFDPVCSAAIERMIDFVTR